MPKLLRGQIKVKIKMQRLSGEVIQLADFRKEFSTGYDLVLKKHVTETDPTKLDAALATLPDETITAIRTDAQALEDTLRAKYGLVKEVTMPTTAKAWHKLIAAEGPLMVAQSSANKSELILIVIDMPIG